MTNKIAELNPKEILAVSGGNGTIDSITNYVETTVNSIKKNISDTIDHISEETWRYTIEPTIIFGGMLFSGLLAYRAAKNAGVASAAATTAAVTTAMTTIAKKKK